MAVLKRRHRLARLLFLCLVFLLSSVEMAQNDVGDLVIVKGGPMTLYTRPATGTRLTEMPDNTVTEIVAGPEIVDGMRWWYVSNNFAWVAEKDSLDGELLPYDPAILEQSIAAATVILDNDPDNVEALFRRGWAYFNLQNYEQATEDLSAAIAQDPENTALYLASGKINLDAGHYTDAIRDLTHALALDPNDLAALNRRGVAYQSFDDYQSASLDYLTAAQLAPEYGLLYYNLGNIARINENFYLALDYYDQALDVDPNLHQVHNGRGYVYLNLGNYALALAEFEQDLSNSWDEYYPYMGLGLTYEILGDWDTALSYYEQAINIDAENSFIYRNRGRLYYKMHRFEDSEADMDRAIAYAPDVAEEYNIQGGIYHQLANFEGAIERFTKSAEQDYRNAHWAIYNRGLVYGSLGRYEEAIADFKDALKLEPFFPAPYLEYGNLLIQMREYDSALVKLNEGITLFPNLAPLYFTRGNLYNTHFHQAEAALADYQQAAARNPYEPEYLLVLGDHSFTLGLYDEALASYEQYMALIGDDSPQDTSRVEVRIANLQDIQARLNETHIQPLYDLPVQDFYDTVGQVVYAWKPGRRDPMVLFRASRETSLLLTPETDAITGLAWSPDGQQVAFADLAGVYLMTPDGSKITFLAAASSPAELQFSPDGTKILYRVGAQLWVVSVDGSQNTHLNVDLGSLSFSNHGIGWSSDSQHILFYAVSSSASTTPGIVQIDIAGTDFEVILPWTQTLTTLLRPQMSLDGRYLAVIASDALNAMLIFDLETGKRLTLDRSGDDLGFAWSPDGTQIAYNSDGGILIADLSEDSIPRPIADEVLDRQSIIGWRGDGQTLLFTACGEMCEIFSIGPDGNGLEQLTNDGGLKFFPAVSPISD